MSNHMSTYKAGRSTRKPAEIPGVETQPCTSGLHVLTNVNLRTFCAVCNVDWVTLDAALRADLARPEIKPDCIDCGVHLMSQRKWQDGGPEKREEWRSLGWDCRCSGNRCGKCEWAAKKGKRIDMRRRYAERSAS